MTTPPLPKRICIHRHAESLSNAGEKTWDIASIPLSEKGHAQAQALARSIAAPPDAIVVSPFLRTAQTAAPIAARFPDAGADLWPIHEFTYLEPSSCVGTSWIERKPRIDAYWARLDPHHVDGPGAESFAHLLGRARAFLDRLTGLKDPHTLFVSHGQFMQATLLLAEAPDFTPHDAMASFRDRQAVAPFANCERLELILQAGSLAATGRQGLDEA
jgi:2,3-bisphosphoglycerate-dependent phosphoglycerate mutase